MLSLSQGRRQNQTAGEPIYSPFHILNASETFIRRSQLTLVSGGPGTGKSAVIQSMLQRGDDRGKRNSVLYFSADSDSTTMFKRAAAIATGYEQSEIDQMIRQGNTDGLESEVDATTAHMRFDYRSSPGEDDVIRGMAAYLETYGAYPEVLVMDNLKNLYIEGLGEFEALEQACVFLHDLAKDTNCAVIALHHVTGEYENGITTIPLDGVRGKVSKTPELVLTLSRQGEDILNVSVVKNRNGKAQASGAWVQPLRTDMSRMAYTG